MTLGHGPKETVEKVEADAKVGIHEAVAVQTFVMNVLRLRAFRNQVRKPERADPTQLLTIESGKEPAGMPALHVAKNYVVKEERTISLPSVASAKQFGEVAGTALGD